MRQLSAHYGILKSCNSGCTPSAEREDPTGINLKAQTLDFSFAREADTGPQKEKCMSHELPAKPSLEYLRKQAKQLQRTTSQGKLADAHNAMHWLGSMVLPTGQ